MHDYKRYRKIYKQISIQKFGQELNELLKKPDKTHDEVLFTQRYFKYLPLNNNNCIMNILCRYVEDSEFDNKWKKSIGEYDYTRLMSRKYNIEDNKLIQKILEVIRELNRTQTMLSKNLSYNENYYDEDEEKRMYNYIYEIYENKLLSLCSNKEMLCDYVVYVFYKHFKNKSMALLWSVFSDIMIENLKNNVGKVAYPVYDQSGVEYLGEKYSIKEVTL